MIDIEAWKIPLASKRTLVVGDSDQGLIELEGLLKTLGGETTERLKVILRNISPSSYIGSGKLEEIRTIIEKNNIEVLLVDFELSPSQMKNIERVVKCLVLDRSGVILEIFSQHARTKEAKLQVELARLQYVMPRLMNLWSHFERQRGSGGGALKGKGMGEKQLEVDRRLIKKRMNFLEDKLTEVEKARKLHRKHRAPLLKAALVGYTNAGKSTLLNALTSANVLVEDALFATLDSSVKLLNPKSRPVVLMMDTVGFIDRLPHTLVASFRSTLSSVLEADLLIHVLDASHQEIQKQFEVTMDVLKELNALHIPMLLVFNKMDRNKSDNMVKVWGAALLREYGLEQPIYLSAYNPEQVSLLRERILKFFEKNMEVFEIIIPYEDGKTMAQLFEFSRIDQKRELEKGTFYRIRTTPEFAHQMSLDKYKTKPSS